MAIYELYISPVALAKIKNGETPQFDRLDQMKIVRDSKSILALAFPIFWLFYHRLWFALGLYICVSVAFALFATTQLGQTLAILSIIPGIYLLLEGNTLIASNLLRQGWQFVHVVEADNPADAELRFLTLMLEQHQENSNLKTDNKPISQQAVMAPQNDIPEFGMFSES